MRTKLLLIVLLLISTLSFISLAQISFEIVNERAILEIDKSGDVYLHYNITIKILSGTVSRFVRIGMPVSSFEVLDVKEVYPDGRVETPKYREERGETDAVVITPTTPITARQQRTYLVSAVIHDFIYPDEMNPGNAGMLFIPTWFSAVTKKLEVVVVFPPGVKKDVVKNTPDYDNFGELSDGRLYYYWVREDLPPDYKFKVGVSFPKEYVERVAERGSAFLTFLSVFLILAVIAGGILLFYKAYKLFTSKLVYSGPEFLVESLGVNEKLSPAEVAYLKKLEGRDISYGRIIAVLIAQLVRKGVLEVESLNPLKLKVMSRKKLLKSFEKRFLDCVKEEMEEDCLVSVIKSLHKRVEWALEGYSRGMTLSYYEEKVRRLWKSIEEAPPSRKHEMIRENLEWLLTDEHFYKNLKRALKGGVAMPEPVRDVDVWIWVGYPHPTLPPSPAPTPTPSTGEVRKPEVPVVTDIERAADSIARSVEEISGQVVRNVEGFADKVTRVIIPSRPRARRSRRAPSVSCACVSCACACACVSCACACAGGGVG